MMKRICYLSIAALLTLAIASCEDELINQSEVLILEISRIQIVGSQHDYGLWLLREGEYSFLGLFDATGDGDELTKSAYEVELGVLSAAEGVLVTIESTETTPTAPSEYRVLAGTFEGSSARLTTSDPAGMGVSFEASSLGYTINTPTDPDSDGQPYGLWYYDPENSTPTLNLPSLSESWIYASWMQTSDTLLYMGAFTSPSSMDDADFYGGSQPGYPAPGQDFIQGNSRMPYDVRDGIAFLSVEPVPDTDDRPFGLRPYIFNVVDTLPDGVVQEEFTDRILMRGLARRR